MRILFVHNNFPAQFGRLGQFLAEKGWDVSFATQRGDVALKGIRVVRYDQPSQVENPNVHPFAAPYDKAVRLGQRAAKAALELCKSGYRPDIIVSHAGWGPGLFLKDIWPDAKFVGYFEWFYKPVGEDVLFLKEKSPGLDRRIGVQARNASILMELAKSDLALCPTQWQQEQFPSHLRQNFTVLHDGIDTDFFAPDPSAVFEQGDIRLTSKDKVITYVARGMEPYRGFPQFMAALAQVQKHDKDVQALIVGQDRVAYGKKLPKGDSFKKRALAELDLDLSRTHFTGLLNYAQYCKVLQISSVHVYLTVPFVLSWSLMEAMSVACPLLVSDTQPVQEMLMDGQSAHFVDFHDRDTIVRGLCAVLENKDLQQKLGQAARTRILENYAAHDIFTQKNDLFTALINQ